ncbi:ATP-binding protein [Streptomyces meridianus]|uniref:ATP-binding protein n=1 Tax=Streptomyces meridianus TaxID=2938945 RepID=A0ABT0X069_9ACTN|nr:ATP-binding protein [Streptomyces meridianus]MCM2575961.1 ATP-binding protein [Streptomyces meridianus]
MTAQTHPDEQELPHGRSGAAGKAEAAPVPSSGAGDGADGPDPGDVSAPGGTAERAAPGVALDEADPRAWDDGLIARRAQDPAGPRTGGHRPPLPGLRESGSATIPAPSRGAGRGHPEPFAPGSVRRGFSRPLRVRLDALRELVGLSRARLDGRTLFEAGRVLEEATARNRLSLDHTVVAIAGATGSGKSSVFNALAAGPVSEAGVRRPTTSETVACVWSDGADGLLDRLGVPPRLRRRPQRLHDPVLRGLVLLDLPDHDSAMPGHREQVDRLLGLVDAVVWIVDPEKYADAVLHERYLRPLAGYAEVSVVVLNQVDRLPGEASVQVLDDLRRLLDEDGVALGEHGEAGAAVLAVSALTGEGIGELRSQLGAFVAERGAPERRLAADVTGAADRLRAVCLADGRTGLTEAAREEYESRLADAVGARAAGQAAEREWMRQAGLVCGAPWRQARRLPVWRAGRRNPEKDGPGGPGIRGVLAVRPAGTLGDPASAARSAAPAVPGPEGRAGGPGPATGRHATGGPAAGAPRASRAMVEQAVRVVSGQAAAGLPEAWSLAVRDAATRGARELPRALDDAAAAVSSVCSAASPVGRGLFRPGWWSVVAVVQWLLLLLQVVGAGWAVSALLGAVGGPWTTAALVTAGSVVGGPLLAWVCRAVARGPARRYGQEVERRLSEAAAACGRSRVLEPIAAELLRYQEVRDQYLVASGGIGAGGA